MWCFFDEIAVTPGDIARSFGGRYYIRERLPHLIEIRRLRRQLVQGRLSVEQRRADRLVQFMGDRGGQFTQCCDPRDMRKLGLHATQRLFGA